MKRIILILFLILIFSSVFAEDFVVGNEKNQENQKNNDNTLTQNAQIQADISNLSKKMDQLQKNNLSKSDVNFYKAEVFNLLDQKVSEFFSTLATIIIAAFILFFSFLGFAKGRKWI